jgi:hypothetical protein
MDQAKREIKVVEKEKKFCQNCGQYSNKTKKCADIKFVPRKGTCVSWIPKKR